MRTERNAPLLYSLSSRHWISRLGTWRDGFTLVELLVAVVVAITLAGIAIPVYSSYQEQAKISKAIGDMAVLENRIEKHLLNTGALPAALTDLEEANLLDPWGRAYQYANYDLVPPGNRRKDRFLVPLNTTYDLYSMGKDGQSRPPITASASQDDIIRANDGGYVGLASNY